LLQGTEDAINGESIKRQRMTPIAGEQGDVDMSQVSDTVIHSSSDKAISNVVNTDEAIAKVNALDDQQENQVSMLLKKVISTLDTTHILLTTLQDQ
jgi:hypothetical protein